MAVNDTVLLTVQGTVGGQRHIHTLHFRYEDIASDEAGLIELWRTTCRTAYRTLFDVDDSPCQLYTARQVCGALPLRAPAEVAETAPNIVGASDFTTDRGPTWLAAVVSVRTASAGKSRRGRFFIGGLFESEFSGNNLVTNHVNRLTAYCTALNNAFIDTGGVGEIYRLVVHSHKLAQPGVQCQDSSTPVTAFIVRTEMGSMKSRKPGSGT